MNENQKEALNIFLEYIFKENDKNKGMETIVQNYIEKQLIDYFGVVSNRIDTQANEIAILKKELSENKSVTVPEKTDQKPKISKAKKFEKTINTSKTVSEQIIEALPEYTNKEITSIADKLGKEYYRHMTNKEVKQLMDAYITPTKLMGITGIPRNKLTAGLSKLFKEGKINKLKLAEDYKRSPVIYYTLRNDESPVKKDAVKDELYKFKDAFNNPGYDLINGLYVKPRRGNGKPLQLNAKQLANLRKLILHKNFTVKVHDELIKRIKECGIVNDGTAEGYAYRLVQGYFNDVIDDYLNYLHRVFNPQFEVYNKDVLMVNGNKVKMDDVNRILEDIPYGYDEDVEDYTTKCINKYSNYPSEVIHTIIENNDNYLLKRHLKRDDFVENNSQKRKEKGIIP